MVVKAARRNGADIEAVARSTGVEIVRHAVVLARAEAAIAKINSGMQRAQRAGVLSQFNTEYKRRRLEAAEQGRSFMSYRGAQARLRRVVARIAATGIAPEAIVTAAFGDI